MDLDSSKFYLLKSSQEGWMMGARKLADRMLTLEEVRRILHVGRTTMYRLVREKEIPALKVGGGWRVLESSLRRWMASREGSVMSRPSQGIERLSEKTEATPLRELRVGSVTTSEGRAMKQPRVLIIDDDPDFVEAIKVIFDRQSYEVTIAENTARAMEVLCQGNVDLIVLDVMLPDQDGYSFCYELKRNRRYVHIPILVLTALPARGDLPDYASKIASSHLADDFAEKPIDPEDLLKRASKLVMGGGAEFEQKERAKTKVLIVDDDPDYVETLKVMLEHNDYQVVVAYDGSQGLREAIEEKPDLIVLDVMLPDRDGYAVCSDLKNDPRCASIPIVIATAVGSRFSHPDYAFDIAFGHRADDYIEKPVNPDELLSRLNKWV